MKEQQNKPQTLKSMEKAIYYKMIEIMFHSQTEVPFNTPAKQSRFMWVLQLMMRSASWDYTEVARASMRWGKTTSLRFENLPASSIAYQVVVESTLLVFEETAFGYNYVSQSDRDDLAVFYRAYFQKVPTPLVPVFGEAPEKMGNYMTEFMAVLKITFREFEKNGLTLRTTTTLDQVVELDIS
tara:strand:+ start:221 stop:769 length:549 start_codon:yes stop_codon:yes gene_type:complete